MTTALVNPEMLRWSRLRARLTTDEVAAKLPTKLERVNSWEDGEAKPTFKQAQKWASVVHVPFGFLFLRIPPKERLELPDLRTVGGQGVDQPSLSLKETITDVLRKQQWFREFLIEHQRDSLQFIGKFSLSSNPVEVANDIRTTLSLPVEVRASNSEEFMRLLTNAAEDVGILVMRSGMVAGNTHRKLDVSEFRGFAISDEIAPVVFINSADAPAARLFTLIHELAHLWIGSTGISNGGMHSQRDEEIFCNAVAGEFLVPTDQFYEHWREVEEWEANFPALTAYFHVSKFVIARKASDLGFISKKQFDRFYLRELNAFRQRESSGGDYYATARAKNSKLFSRAVLGEALSGRMLLRDAGQLLGIGPEKIRIYAGKIAT